MSLLDKIDTKRLPQHVAIIMDGNGRWAKARGEERYVGHQEGVVSVRKVVEAASDLGIRYLTMYTFSTENWNRPKEEVDALMTLMVAAIKKETPDLMKNNVRLDAIGNLARLPEEARKTLMECIEETSVNTGTTVVLALSYSSRWEITDAVKQIAAQVKSGELDIESITEETISQHLTTRNIPDPDLLVRTGGEQRCCGSCHTQSFTLQTHIGRILGKKNYMKLSCIISIGKDVLVKQASN